MFQRVVKCLLVTDSASGYSQVLKTATISGTTVTFGSSVFLSTSGNNADQAGLAYDTTNNRAFISYKDQVMIPVKVKQ